MNIAAGTTVPLSLQLFDGREDMRVRAHVIDAAKQVVFDGELLSVGGGLYLTRELLMPETDWLLATYQVFDGTLESNDYERALDVFTLDRSASVIAQVESSSEAVVEKLAPPSLDGFLTGVLGEAVETDQGFMMGRLTDGSSKAKAS